MPRRAGVQRQQADVFFVDHDAPGVARHDADHHVEGGGFTGAVRPEQADDLAGFHFQADVFDNFTALVGFRGFSAMSVAISD